MAVQKLKIFLWADGLIILLAVIFFVVMYLRRGNKNQFRDDLWEKRKPLDPKQRAAEDQIDQKILLEHRPEPGDAEPEAPKPQPESQPKPAPRRAEFQLPNFRGKPHEVLGVPANADADLIGRAYKHWIKRYHPDRVTHLGPNYVDQARRRAEQLNTARQALIQAILQRKK